MVTLLKRESVEGEDEPRVGIPESICGVPVKLFQKTAIRKIVSKHK